MVVDTSITLGNLLTGLGLLGGLIMLWHQIGIKLAIQSKEIEQIRENHDTFSKLSPIVASHAIQLGNVEKLVEEMQKDRKAFHDEIRIGFNELSSQVTRLTTILETTGK